MKPDNEQSDLSTVTHQNGFDSIISIGMPTFNLVRHVYLACRGSWNRENFTQLVMFATVILLRKKFVRFKMHEFFTSEL